MAAMGMYCDRPWPVLAFGVMLVRFIQRQSAKRAQATGECMKFLHLARRSDGRADGHICSAAERSFPYDETHLEPMRILPVQEGGRIKPLSTAASFLMLRLHGSRSLKVEFEQNGVMVEEKLEPTAWFMDCMFFPRQADNYAVFRVEDSAILDVVGLGSSRQKEA